MNPMTAYGVVHYLLRQQHGAARDHLCASCLAPAAHWAYDHRDVFERVDVDTRQVFSVNFDHYKPLCQRCHQRLDAANETRIQPLVEKAVAEYFAALLEERAA